MSNMNNANTRDNVGPGGFGGGRAKAPPAPALDPRRPLLAQPFAKLVQLGVIAKLQVEFEPFSVTVKGKASAQLVAVKDSGLNETDFFSAEMLFAVADRGGLVPAAPGSKKAKAATSGANVAPKVPAKSLCAADLAQGVTPEQVQARANAVASAVGGAPLVGRVRSAGKFTGTETQSYQKWWDQASGDLRALSLCQGRYYAALKDEDKKRLEGLQCPFRRTLDFLVAADEEESQPE